MRCKHCAYSVFDERWAEYKCKAKHKRIYDPAEATTCKDYKHKRREKK